MRTLVILRGLPGSGKSFFVKENNLQAYTISSDLIRLQFQSPILSNAGKIIISQSNDKSVWEYLFEVLENKMKKGEYIVIDATHATSSSFKSYKKLVEKYRYRTYCIDFSDIDLDIIKQRNKQRKTLQLKDLFQ